MADERCRACGSKARFAFAGTLLARQVAYFECSDCGYLQTETPIWLQDAYSDPINVTDTGIVARNLLNARRVGAVCLLLRDVNARIVDFAGGHGLLVRMLRDAGLDAFWSDKFCPNEYARGFEHDGSRADLVTAFESFEHFVEPGDELDRMLSIAPVVLLSTLLLPTPTPVAGSWWYYGEEHGQHVGFFRRRTLERMATDRGAVLTTNGIDLHAFIRTPKNLNFAYLRWAMRAWPIVCRYFLHSKVGADHEAMKARLLARAQNIQP